MGMAEEQEMYKNWLNWIIEETVLTFHLLTAE